jgi:YD repeat-containing protein
VAQADGSTAQATERNPQGQPTRQVNADGTITFYTYNERGLEIERAQFDATFATATTRPALTKATSVTSTRWHGQWNLPKEVAQPQLTTSYTYNARGDVTGYSTQATTDPTGAQKFEAIGTGPIDAMGYAYNANAQLARIVQLQNGTETARWTLGYNDQGDVQRLTYTDATTLDPTTLAPTETTQRIPQYDPHGRPEVIVTPDGSRTRLIYNQRGALIRLVQGEQITHFTYDARGVMTRIKTPDGSVFALVYDSDVNLTQIRHNGKAITTAYVQSLPSDTRTTVDALRFAQPRLFPDADFSRYISYTSRQQTNALRREKAQFLPAAAALLLSPEFAGMAFGFSFAFAIDYWRSHSTPALPTWNTRYDIPTRKQAANPAYCSTPGYGDAQPKPPLAPLIYPPLPERDQDSTSTTTPVDSGVDIPLHTGGTQIQIPPATGSSTFIPLVVQHWKELIFQARGQGGQGVNLPVKEPTTAPNGLSYQSNVKHSPGPQQPPDAGTEPPDSFILFGKSIPSPIRPDDVRYTVDSKGEIHRFSSGNNGIWHWSGSTGDVRAPMASTQIPIAIRRLPGVDRDIRLGRR